MKYKTKDLFNLSETIAASLFDGAEYPWRVLASLSNYIIAIGSGLAANIYNNPSENVWIAKDAIVAPSASIVGPCIIDSGAEIRHCAYIRGSVIVGKNAVVGNSTELKNSLLFNGVQVPHFNYVGDSILGYKAHFGAGVITANVKNDKSNVRITSGDEPVQSGLKKLGAMVGDHADVGCNSVLAPGCVLGENCRVYPLSFVRGTLLQGSILKSDGSITTVSE